MVLARRRTEDQTPSKVSEEHSVTQNKPNTCVIVFWWSRAHCRIGYQKLPRKFYGDSWFLRDEKQAFISADQSNKLTHCPQ